MRFSKTIFTSCFLLVAFAPLSQAYTPLDKTVALVEDGVILQSELEQRLLLIRKDKPDLTITDEIRTETLNQLIMEELQLDLASRARVTIPEANISRVKNRLLNKLADEGKSFESYLAERQMTEAKFDNEILNNLKIKEVQKGNINRRLRITDREIDEFLESKAGEEWLKTRYRIGHILISDKGRTDQALAELANTIMAQLNIPGTSFGKLAQQYSDGPNAAQGGDLGWRETKELPGIFVQQVSDLEPGDIATPLRSGAGVHILKLIERTGAEPVFVKRYKVRHILISPTELFTDAEAEVKIRSLYARLEDGADFIELAREYTEDTASKNSGGDLGWSTPGQFVPEFETAMQSTPVGTYSEPFRSSFGWHILKVDDAKTEDMFETVKRNQVANILRSRQFNDELQLWQQELLENAYVEIL